MRSSLYTQGEEKVVGHLETTWRVRNEVISYILGRSVYIVRDAKGYFFI